MSDNDFVARLRIRWDAMGDMANDERAAAATEIESLRSGQREMMRTITRLMVERDEARREVCDNNRVGLPPRQLAKLKCWDCFDLENTND